MAIRRASIGLLAEDKFDRPELGARWTQLPGSRFSILFNNGVLHEGSVQRETGIIYTQGDQVTREMVVQADLMNSLAGSRVGLWGRGTRPDRGYVVRLEQSPDNGSLQRARLYGPGGTVLGTGTAPWAFLTSTPVKLVLGVNSQRVYVNGALDLTRAHADVEGLSDEGWHGVVGGILPGTTLGAVSADNYLVYRSNAITVQGLPAGYKARVNAVTVDAVDGVAVVDLGGASCPLAAAVQVLDAASALVEQFVPAGGMYGGDVFVFEGATVPPTDRYFTGFTAEPIGRLLGTSGFEPKWGDSSEWRVASAVAGSVDNRVVTNVPGIGRSPLHFLQWTTAGQHVDQEVLIRFKRYGSVGGLVALRASSGDVLATQRAYLVQLGINRGSFTFNPNGFTFIRLRDGAQQVLAQVGTSVLPGRWYYGRFQAVGTTLRGRVWEEQQAEPSAWQLVHTDGVVGQQLTDAGTVGILNLDSAAPTSDRDNNQLFVDSISLGVNGASAEMRDGVDDLPYIPPLRPIMGARFLTLFQDDDKTPLMGLVHPITGEILEATVSSHPDHPRPWLKGGGDASESEVRFKEGKSVIGQQNYEVLDKRTSWADQDSGFWTGILSDGRDSLMLGHRAVLQEMDETGNLVTIMDGVNGAVSLSSTLVGFKSSIKDMRERERKQRTFTRSGFSILPYGPTNGYGKLPDGSLLIRPVRPMVGTVRQLSLTTARVEVDWALSGFLTRVDWERYSNEKWEKWQRFNYANAQYNQDTGQFALRLTAALFRWRPRNSGGPWRELRDMPLGETPLLVPAIDIVQLKEVTTNRLRYLNLASDDDTALPPLNSQIEFQVISLLAPTEDEPFLYSGNLGQLVENVYRGEYGEPNSPRVRYGAAAMARYKAETPDVNVMITEPADNVREWVEEHAFMVSGHGPVMNDLGELEPIKYELPDERVDLIELNDANVVSAEWEHGPEELVTKVSMIYHRDFLIPNDPNNPKSDWDRLKSREVIFDRVAASQSLHGDQVLEFKPDTLRAVTTSSAGATVTGSVNDEVGAQYAEVRANDALNRFSNGAQRLNVKALRQFGDVRVLRPGMWVLLNLSWLPDYRTRKRGLQRIAQVVKVRKGSLTNREFVLLDGGPYLVPLLMPTITDITQDNLALTVGFTITDLPVENGIRAKAHVRLAVAETMPSIDAGPSVWRTQVITDQLGEHRTELLPAGANVWLSWRSELPGRRPSAWSVPTPIVFPQTPSIQRVELALSADGTTARARWYGTSFAQGIRVWYIVRPPGTDTAVVFTTFIDVDADAGELIFPVTVQEGEQLEVSIQPYAGFDGSVVFGAAGQASQTLVATMQPDDGGEVVLLPVIKERPVETATTGTLRLDIDDPQGRVTEVAFSAAQGNNALGPYQVDPDDPYTWDVPLADKQPSRIAYRVRFTNGDGQIQTMENVVPFAAMQTPTALVFVNQTVQTQDEIIDTVEYGLSTNFIDVWYREYTAHPGNPGTMEFIGGRLMNMPLRRDDNRRQIRFPVGASGNFITRTYIPYDALGHRGMSATFTTASLAASPPRPNLFDQVVKVPGSETSTSVQFDATMPADITTPAPLDQLVFRINFAAIVRFPRTAGAGGVQRVTITGLTPGTAHAFRVWSETNAGISSPLVYIIQDPVYTLSPALDPVPYVNVETLIPSGGGSTWYKSITWEAGANHPIGTEYHVFIGTEGDPGSYTVQVGEETTGFELLHAVPSVNIRSYAVEAIAPGYGPSPRTYGNG